MLNDPCLKLTQAKDVRWLSHDKVVSNVRRCLPSMITSLEREAEECYNAKASGLAAFVKTYKFVSALYMFCDVLPPLAGLSRAFQKHDIDFTVVKPLVVGTKAAIDALLLVPGDCFSSLPKVLPELEEFGVQQPTDHQIQQFKQHVYDKYLETLSQHITNRFPDMSLLEGVRIFEHLATLLDHYGTHGVVDSQATKLEFRTFNSVIASNPGLKQLTMRQLMSHVIKTPEFNVMFPNLMKLATIGLLLLMSTVDCERGFQLYLELKLT